jgi:hypothetical protein
MCIWILTEGFKTVLLSRHWSRSASHFLVEAAEPELEPIQNDAAPQHCF